MIGRNQATVLGMVLAVVVLVGAGGAAFISPFDPFEQSAADRMNGPDAVHIMGRDTFGRDVFARVLHAGRISLTVGVGSVALGGALGTLLGLVAGYSGGWLEGFPLRAVGNLM